MTRDILSQAFRQVWRDRRITVVVVATVAAASAGATVLVAAIGGALGVRVPLVQIDTLVEASRKYQSMSMRYPAWSYPFVRDVSAASKYTKFASSHYFFKTLDTPAGPSFTLLEAVTPSYADVLDVHPDAGRWFSEEENRVPLRDDVMVISHGFCRKFFERADECVGSSIRVGSAALTVIGVMPDGFRGLGGVVGNTDAWVPSMLAPLGLSPRPDPTSYLTDTGLMMFTLVGRVKSLADLPAAQAEFVQVAHASAIKEGVLLGKGAVASETSPTNYWPTYNLTPEREVRTDPVVVRAGRIVDAAIALLLLMTCGNATLLMIARAYARSRQIAIQMALGASRGRIFAGMAAETMFIAAATIGAGFALSVLASRALTAIAGSLDELRVAGFSFSVESLQAGLRTSALVVSAGIVVALAVALLTSWRVLRNEISADAHPLARRMAGSLRTPRWQGSIVAVQVCCAVVLTISAGLLIRSYFNAVNGELGIQISSDLLGVRLSGDVSDADSQAIVTALSSGGFRAAARVACLPLSSHCYGTAVTAPGLAGQTAASTSAVFNRVDAAALSLLGVPVREGRAFSEADDAAAPKVAILSRSALAQLGMKAGSIGQTIDVAGFGPAELVGVVDDVKYDGLTERAKPAVYMPWTQYRLATPATIVARAEGPASAMAAVARARLQAIRRDLATSEISPFMETVHEMAMEQRLQMALLLAFAAIGIGISAAGILGVTSFTVNLGVPEIGLRLALGATPASIVGLVASRIGRFVAAGVAAGLLISTATHTLWTPLLYQVNPLDPGILLSCTILASGIAAVNVLWIARRAACIDPSITLRSE